MIARNFARPLRAAGGKFSPMQAAQSVRTMSGFSSISPRSLEEIVKKELIAQEPADRMEKIWEQYHEESRSAAGFCIFSKDYDTITSRLKESPLCIWPVFKNETEHFMLISQVLQDKYIACAYLEEYKQNPETAAPWISIALFDDFCESKKMALVRSDFTPNISKEEGDLTTRMILHAYHDDDAFAYVKTFNHDPAAFDYEKFLTFFKLVGGDLKEDAEARAAAKLAPQADDPPTTAA